MEKKVIILDFDGTLYSGNDIFCYVPEYIEKHRRDFFSNVSDSDYEMIIRENPEFLNSFIGSSVVRAVYQFKEKYPHLKIDISDFTNCQENFVYDINLGRAHFVDIDFITKLCSEYPVYIVSNSAVNHIKHYMKVLGINPQIFKAIISNKFEAFDSSKQHYYEQIVIDENIEPQNLFVFGDSENSDLKPARNIGANAILSTDAAKLKELVYSSLNN